MLAPLEGYTVGITADRRHEEQALLVARLGGTVVHGPCIRTLPLGDLDELRELTRDLIERPPAVVVANTGIGMRAWFEAAASWGLEPALHQALCQATILARGPKAAGAVAAAGLAVAWRAPGERLDDVAAHLSDLPLRGRRVALQLHGDRREPVTEVARRAGAEVVAVPVYRWDVPEDPAIHGLLDALAAGRVDAVTFTSTPAVEAFFALMSERADEARIAEVMAAKVAVACVGPVCAEAARSHGVPEPVVPERSRLGSMVWALAEHLESRRIVLHAHGPTPARLVLQGAVALVGAAKVRLSERERAVLGVLAGRAGAVVGRAELLRRVWGDPTVDAHVLEVTVGRLRRKLGDAGRMIRTVPRRGYRLDATREVPTASRP